MVLRPEKRWKVSAGQESGGGSGGTSEEKRVKLKWNSCVVQLIQMKNQFEVSVCI